MKKLLIIGSVWPEPNSSAAGSRMMQLIDVFHNEGYKITFATAAYKSDFSVVLEDYGVEEEQIKLNDSSFDSFVKELNPDVVIFDRFNIEEQYGWRVAEFSPNALRILDTEDLHFLRKARHEALKKNKEVLDIAYSDLQTTDAKREIASILRCDLSLLISQFEMDLLVNKFKIDKDLLLYLPFLLDKIEADNWKSFSDREHFIFIGNFIHAPNWDAVLQLKNEIWPSIRKQLPKAKLHIYGSYPPQKVWNLHNEQQGFIIKGRAESAHEVVGGAKVMLAPLRFGAGIKGKLIEAMQCGTPSVTTQIGAESMRFDKNWNGFVTDDNSEFIVQAIVLYKEESLWNSAQINGTDIINSCYAIPKWSASLVAKVNEIQDNLDKHRASNFMGQILQHQTFQSSRYMSYWIAEKTKNNNT